MPRSTPILPPEEMGTGSNGIPAVARCKDFAGSSFTARLIQAGNSTYVELFKTTSVGGTARIGDFEMQDGPVTGKPPAPRKMVDVHLMLDGDNIVATVTGYDLTSPTRKHYQEEYVFAHIAVPFPVGVSPESGAGPAMFRSEGNPQPQEEPVDYDKIKQIVKVEVDAAKTLIIANMISKTKAAIDEANVLTLANIYTSDGLYQRFVDTTSEEVIKALKSYGVAKEPKP